MMSRLLLRIFEEYYDMVQQIKNIVTDTSVILNDALDQGKTRTV